MFQQSYNVSTAMALISVRAYLKGCMSIIPVSSVHAEIGYVGPKGRNINRLLLNHDTAHSVFRTT